MNIVLWIVQVLLALAFFGHGVLFVAPPAEMAAMLDTFLPPAFRIFIGVAEILAAFGLILPALTRILPILTVLSGAGLMIVMASAVILHLVRAEYPSVISGLVLLALATFVTYGRWKLRPIAPRGGTTPAVSA